MKPRTTIPASLMRDLRLYAYYSNDLKLSRDLLAFDIETKRAEWNTPTYLAEKLGQFSRRIARRERSGRDAARSRLADNTVGSHEGAKNAPGPVGADVVEIAEYLKEEALLQARIWRVIEGLMLGAQGPRPRDRQPGCCFYRPAEGLR